MVCHIYIRCMPGILCIMFHPLVQRLIVRSTKGALAHKSLWEDSQEQEYANLRHIHVGHTVCLNFEMNNRGKECRQNMTRCPKLQQV